MVGGSSRTERTPSANEAGGETIEPQKSMRWFEERLGLAETLSRPTAPRGLRIWFHFPGAFAVVLIAWQIWTGACISPYAPEHSYLFSPFLHNGHRWGAQLLLLCVAAHFAHSFCAGRYRRPREIQWLFGCATGCAISLSFITGSILARHQAGGILTGGTFPAGWLFSDSPELEFFRVYVWHISLLPMSFTALGILHIWLGTRAVGAAPADASENRNRGTF